MSSRFSNNYFPQEFSSFARIQKQYNVHINTLESGKEQRIYRGRKPSKFFIDGAKALVYVDDSYSFKNLDNHYNSMAGSFRAFRFKFNLDCFVNKANGFIGKSGFGNGRPDYQLYKFEGNNLDFGIDDFKKIVLPLNFKAYVDGVLDENCVVDSLTGIVRFAPRKRGSINSFSKSGLNVTFNLYGNHNFVVDEVIYINITNKSNYLYDKTFKITSIADKSITITLNEDVAIASISSIDSYIDLYPQSNNVLRAEFEFDYPVRYDSAEFSYDQQGELVNFQSIVLIEVFDDLTNF